MKGIVFTEFLDLVEDKFGLEMVDRIIAQSNLESGGSYTSVGTYDFGEMLQLVTNLSSNTDIPVNELLLIYGEHFFSVLRDNYREMLNRYSDPIELLASIENHIHVEVKKLYPDAELPTFKVLKKTSDELIMVYTSSRAMHHFGLGLMNKTFEHFNLKATIDLEYMKEDGTEVKFKVKRLYE